MFCGPDGERIGPVETDEEVYGAIKAVLHPPDPWMDAFIANAKEYLARHKEED